MVHLAREAGRAECARAAWNEIRAALAAMEKKRKDASYKDCATAIGILADKLAGGLDPDLSATVTGPIAITVNGVNRPPKDG